MKGSNIVSAIHHLRMAEEHYEDFIREFPNSMGARVFKSYITKIKWIYNDLVTHPHISQEVREGVKAEIKSDVFAVPAINDKVALLNPDQRDIIEATIDAMLAGEDVKIIDINE